MKILSMDERPLEYVTERSAVSFLPAEETVQIIQSREYLDLPLFDEETDAFAIPAALNPVETDLVEFLAEKKGLPIETVCSLYLKTRRRFNFASLAYRELGEKLHNLFALQYNVGDERAAIETYKYHELLHLLRFVSYSFPAPGLLSRALGIFRMCCGMLVRFEFRRLFSLVKRQFRQMQQGAAPKKCHFEIALDLFRDVAGPPVVVDYGCGLAYISLELARLIPASKIYLVDVDCLTLEFAAYRFKKRGFHVETIPVTAACPYPALPEHNLCIATEVMEHLIQPMTAFRNIDSALQQHGVLYGDFSDHAAEMLHVSEDLHELRESIGGDFHRMDEFTYRKTRA